MKSLAKQKDLYRNHWTAINDFQHPKTVNNPSECSASTNTHDLQDHHKAREKKPAIKNTARSIANLNEISVQQLFAYDAIEKNAKQ